MDVSQISLPVAQPPDRLFRGALSRLPWLWPTGSEERSTPLCAYATADVATVRTLLAAPHSPLLSDQLSHDAATLFGLAAAGHRVAQRRGAGGPLVIQGAAPAGVFFDLRDQATVTDLRWELSLVREFHNLLKWESGDGVTDGLRQVLALLEVRGVQCGGYLELDRDDVDIWQVFPAGVGHLDDPLDLGADADSYLSLARLAAESGIDMPIAPPPAVARELLTRSLRSADYPAIAATVAEVEADAV